MINFAVGPVQSEETVLNIGAEQLPYFRTPEFSQIMLENESLMKRMVHASAECRVVFLTGSGTAAMEASVMNLFGENDRLLVINGGSFGARFAALCRIHDIPFTEIALKAGHTLRREELAPYAGQGYTGLLINICETSTGVLYDMDMVAAFCRENHIFLAADAISSFLADPLDMTALSAGAVITGSQKALACPPGVSVIVLSPEAIKRVYSHQSRCMYLDLRDALENGLRGQTPFTPAVGILLQIHARLASIEAAGGAAAETARIAALAADFRGRIGGLPFEIFSDSLSGSVTPLHPLTASAYDIFTILQEQYGIWVCPNGGALKDTVFRVGHIGALTPADNEILVSAFCDLQRRNLL